jgi:hypothetical protein
LPRRTLAPHGRRRCGHGGKIHGFDGGARNLMTDVALDIGQGDGVLLATEADGITFGAGTRGTADAVYVILRVVRQIEIKYVAHIGNVQAP